MVRRRKILIKIKEFKDKEKLEQPLLVSNIIQGVTTKGSPYLSITFQDKSGQIEGKLWDVKPEQLQLIKQGLILLVSFEVLNYREQLQIKIFDIKELDQSTVAIDDFLPESTVSSEQLQASIKEFIDEIKNPIYHTLVKSIVDEVGYDFYVYPAASKNHHEYKGGLGSHVVSMILLAKEVIRLYPLLDHDLLMSGVILHDIGKTIELSGPILTEYTTVGKLLGHISIVNTLIYHHACIHKLEQKEETMLLQHCVLSHHGQYDFGSPVLPLIPEAEVLHLIDNIDARMNMFGKVLENIEEGTFTPRVFSLENRTIYKKKV
jgi:3'-5' exoribonuclease